MEVDEKKGGVGRMGVILGLVFACFVWVLFADL